MVVVAQHYEYISYHWTIYLKIIKMVNVVMCSLPSSKTTKQNKTKQKPKFLTYHGTTKPYITGGSPVSLISYALCSSLYTWYLPSFCALSPWTELFLEYSSPSLLTTQVRASVLPPQRNLSWPTLKWPPLPLLFCFHLCDILTPKGCILSVSYQEVCGVHLPHSWWC